ncbi:MAG: PKD domain-containing protein [Saprospiraceae bacterium]|nr:PKD domain-containing protein [Saprospiraceae bacterium]
MRTFGIRISVLIIIFLISHQNGKTQCDTSGKLCFDSDCGIYTMGLITDDIVSFCEGLTSTIRLDTIKTAKFDSFFIYWCDGPNPQVFSGNILEFNHVYDNIDAEGCLKPFKNFTITVIGIKYCGSKRTCANASTTIRVQKKPQPLFSFNNSICFDTTVLITNSSCYVDDTYPNAYRWDFGDNSTSTLKNPKHKYPTTGVYNIKLTVANKCGEAEIEESISLPINVVGYPTAKVNISPSARDGKVCVGDRIMLIDTSNQWAVNNKWTFPSNKNPHTEKTDWKVPTSLLKKDSLSIGFRDSIHYVDTIILDMLKVGKYKFTLTSTNACSTVVWTFECEVVNAPTVGNIAGIELCESGIYDPSPPSISGTVNGYEWIFEQGNPPSSNILNPGPVSFNTPGTHKITFKAQAECGTIEKNTTVQVYSKDAVSISNFEPQYCLGSSIDTLAATPGGGIWKGKGTQPNLGTFNPALAGVGKHQIIYTVGPPICQSSDTIEIEVVPSENITIPDLVLCEDDPKKAVSNITGGQWSGHPAIDATGIFDPAISGSGVFNVQFEKTDANGCLIEKTIAVTVQALPQISVEDTAVACAGNDLLNLTSLLDITSNQGAGRDSFVYNGVKLNSPINLGAFPAGNYPIQVYHINKACVVSDSAILTVISDPVIILSKDTTVCNAGSLQLTSNVSGGTWEGPGIDPNTGSIDLNNITAGEHIFTYAYYKGESCEQLPKVKVTVINPGAGLNINGPTSLCSGASAAVTLSASQSGGSWTGVSVGASTGTINVSGLKTDTSYTYQYCRDVPGLLNCQACASHTLIIQSLPVSSFDINGLGCINEPVIFVNNSLDSDTITSTLWNFGDGITSTQFTPPSHLYTLKQNYTVSLTVTNENGCSHTTTQNIYITQKPENQFDLLSDAVGCAPYAIGVSNTSSGDNISFEWKINGITFPGPDVNGFVIDSLIKETTFSLELTVSNACGPVSRTESFTVKPYPIAKIGVSDEEGCSPLIINFANPTLGNADVYAWDLGNGQSYTDSLPPKQTYTASDSLITVYTVTMIATNGCGKDTAQQNITVYPPDVQAFIQASGQRVCQYDTLGMTAFSTPGSVNTWKIIKPDGSTFGAAGDSTLVPFDQSGRYLIVLFASRCGSDSDTAIVDVIPAPQPAFVLPPFLCLNDTLALQPSVPGLAGASWDLGDGTIANGFAIRHQFAQPGNYAIKLTTTALVTGCSNSITQNLLVVGAPTAAFTQDVTSGCQPLTVQFSNTSSGASQYNWDFGDQTSNSQQAGPKHTFEQSGTFQVKMTASDNYGCFEDTSLLNILVFPKPAAAFTFSKASYCTLHDSLRLNNQSTGAVSYLWQINQLTDSMSLSPSLPLDEAGEVRVTLIARSDKSCTDTLTSSVTVYASPVANIASDVQQGCEDLNVQFKNTSLYSSQYFWNFTNGDVSAQSSPSVIFTEPGSYLPYVVALGNDLCPPDTAWLSITVHPKPESKFDFIKDSICGTPMQVSLINQSTGQQENQWLLDGKTIAQSTDLKVTLDQDKTYTLGLITKTIHNCLDTLYRDVPIYRQPLARFDIKTDACEGEELNITNLSTNANSYQWTIDGKGSTENFEPVLSFDKAGSYNIRLIAIYNEFCKDTTTLAQAIKIYTSPMADFTWTTGFADETRGEVQFNHLCRDFTSLLWNFGDGYFTDSLNPLHEYDINRPIEVTLTAYNDNAGLWTCVDSIQKTIAPEWIKTFYAPNALTPEYGERLVRVFKPVGIGMKKYDMAIYSPWGEKVWSSSELDENGSPTEAWDGTYGGSIVPQGSYTWRVDIEWVDGTGLVRVGSVTVLR